jgi:hypothetical protein
MPDEGGQVSASAPVFLVNAAPDKVLGLVDTVPGTGWRLAGAVYRASAHLHRDVDAGVRRQVLALDAARYGDRDLAALIDAVPVEGRADTRWAVEWATGSTVDHRFRRAVTGHTDRVGAVATAVVDGRTVAVTCSEDRTVRVWDLATGRSVGEPLTGPNDSEVRAVATGSVDGRSVAVTGSRDTVVGRGVSSSPPPSPAPSRIGATIVATLQLPRFLLSARHTAWTGSTMLERGDAALCNLVGRSVFMCATRLGPVTCQP